MLTEPDDPLADRRVHHVARVHRDVHLRRVREDQLVDVLGPVALVPLIDQGPGPSRYIVLKICPYIISVMQQQKSALPSPVDQLSR
jgi:hypothetical protein